MDLHFSLTIKNFGNSYHIKQSNSASVIEKIYIQSIFENIYN
jgi:hypothetical protein